MYSCLYVRGMTSVDCKNVLLRLLVWKCESFLSGVVATAACSVFLHLSSGIGFDGVLRLPEVEDSILPAFGKSHAEIACHLTEEGHRAMKVSVLKFLRWYEQTGTHSRNPGTRKASKMIDNAKRIIKEQMNKEDETTGCELQKLLFNDGITVCASTAPRRRQQLGWTSKGTSCCQMIREVKKEKRLTWAI